MDDDIPLWELLGYNSEEEFITDEQKEKEKILRENQEAHEDEILQAIENQTYAPDNQEAQESEAERQAIIDAQYKEFEQKKQRTFDEIVDKFAPALVGLKGESYKVATRMIFYSILANQLKRNYFALDGKKIDMRIPLLIMIKAGYGKKSYEQLVKNTITGIGKTYAEPTSYVSEQFVGKVLINDSKDFNDPDRYMPVLGYLGCDFMVIDEAYELLTMDSPNHQETLKYVRTALDPIGFNEVEKKQVNIPHDHRLRYSPDCTIILMTQPIAQVDEKLLIKGSFRRFNIVMVDTPFKERIEAVTSGKFLVDAGEKDKKIWDIWIRNNKTFSERRLKFSGADEDFDLINQFVISLITDLYHDQIKSDEAIEFTNTMLFNIKQTIFKMAIVRASVEQMRNDNIVIERRNIESAIADYKTLWAPQIKWIRRNMMLQADNPVGWKDDLHGWILRGLEGKEFMEQAKLIEIYMEQNKGSAAESTLRNRISRAIRDLKKWDIIKDKYSGNIQTPNAKILFIPKNTAQAPNV